VSAAARSSVRRVMGGGAARRRACIDRSPTLPAQVGV
jgi:hypothetical protein